MSTQRNFSDQLRAIIKKSKMSRYAISQATSVSEGSLCRFVHGEGGLTLKSIDKISQCLQLRVESLGSDGKRNIRQ